MLNAEVKAEVTEVGLKDEMRRVRVWGESGHNTFELDRRTR